MQQVQNKNKKKIKKSRNLKQLAAFTNLFTKISATGQHSAKRSTAAALVVNNSSSSYF